MLWDSTPTCLAQLPRSVIIRYRLCNLHGSGKLRQLSLAMLLSICEHFDIYAGNIKARRKAPYLSLLEELLELCDCHHSSRL